MRVKKLKLKSKKNCEGKGVNCTLCESVITI